MRGTEAVLDRAVLDWLAAEALPGAQVVATRPLAGGFTNDNVLLTTRPGGRFVLRRFRRDGGGASCAIEAALAARLRGVVPVPEVIAADPDGAATGRPTLLSEFVPGELLSTVLATPAGADDGLGRAVGGALAAIGTVRFDRSGAFTGPDLIPDSVDLATDLVAFVADCLARSAAPLSATERDRVRRLAERDQAVLAQAADSAALVHSDFNPKNILVRRESEHWVVGAVLDWEFAYSGRPLADIGNMLRFPADLPDPFGTGLLAGLRAAGADLPAGWRDISRALDLFALADLLTRPPDHPLFDKVLGALRARL